MLTDERGETDLGGKTVVDRLLVAPACAQNALNAVRELQPAHRGEDEIVDQPRGRL